MNNTLQKEDDIFDVPKNLSERNFSILKKKAEDTKNMTIQGMFMVHGDDYKTLKTKKEFVNFLKENSSFLKKEIDQSQRNEEAVKKYSQLKDKTDLTSRDLLELLSVSIDDADIRKEIENHEHKLKLEEQK